MKCMRMGCANECPPRRRCCSDECMSKVRSSQASKRTKQHPWHWETKKSEHVLVSDLKEQTWQQVKM